MNNINGGRYLFDKMELESQVMSESLQESAAAKEFCVHMLLWNENLDYRAFSDNNLVLQKLRRHQDVSTKMHINRLKDELELLRQKLLGQQAKHSDSMVEMSDYLNKITTNFQAT